MRKAKEIEVNGKTVGIMHLKCWYVMERHDRSIMNDKGRYYEGSPTIYDMGTGKGVKRKEDLTPEELAKRQRAESEFAALRERQKEIAAQRELEEVPKSWNDPRDPQEMTLEELVEAKDELEESLGTSAADAVHGAESRVPAPEDS